MMWYYMDRLLLHLCQVQYEVGWPARPQHSSMPSGINLEARTEDVQHLGIVRHRPATSGEIPGWDALHDDARETQRLARASIFLCEIFFNG